MNFVSFDKLMVNNKQLPGLKRKYYWLLEPIRANTANGEVLVTPSGRIFDAHSIPFWARIFTGHFTSILPAGMHDEDYLTNRIPRGLSDANYRLALRYFNAHPARAFFARTGLLVGSGKFYRRYGYLNEKYGPEVVQSYHWAETEEEALEKASKGLSWVLS